MEENMCEICFTNVLCKKNTKTLKCKHIMCKECFQKLIKKECPFCRCPLASNDEIKKGALILEQVYIDYNYNGYSIPSTINRDFNNLRINSIYYGRSLDSLLDNDTVLNNTRQGRRIRKHDKKIKKSSYENLDFSRKKSKSKNRHRNKTYEITLFEFDDL